MLSAVFLDRDGTLNREVGYLHRMKDVAWIPGVPDALAALNQAGVRVLVVTNQSGVARGMFTLADVDALHHHMQADLRRRGAHIDAFYISPYHPEATVPAFRRASRCRKPGPGLFERGLAEWDLDPAACRALGDKPSDIQAAHAAGIPAALVTTGYGADAPSTDANAVFDSLPAALPWLLPNEPVL